ncbi:hypothetical protein J2T12_005344 [Paenibacillus anaericanus]|uniref:hypothetical protein n=1 Tax=Paenibacillus anaericanus TaxID=170367 RepID=UPI0027872EFB|nr:hypothetical protein [Paenibacillus anaericanus]MDQ0091901.1 hypothetical protein [Paenibacillus anaericanus]
MVKRLAKRGRLSPKKCKRSPLSPDYNLGRYNSSYNLATTAIEGSNGLRSVLFHQLHYFIEVN